MKNSKIIVLEMYKFKFLPFLILIFLISSSCKRDCARTVKNMEFYSVVSERNSEPSSIEGWYHSEFQKRPLHFTIEFSHYGAGEFCDYYWGNYPLESTIEITSDKVIIVGNDTINANENLIDYFSIQKFEKDFFISFLITENAEKMINLNSDYYTFTLNLSTDKNEQMQDKCIVKLIR